MQGNFLTFDNPSTCTAIFNSASSDFYNFPLTFTTCNVDSTSTFYFSYTDLYD